MEKYIKITPGTSSKRRPVETEEEKTKRVRLEKRQYDAERRKKKKIDNILTPFSTDLLDGNPWLKLRKGNTEAICECKRAIQQ